MCGFVRGLKYSADDFLSGQSSIVAADGCPPFLEPLPNTAATKGEQPLAPTKMIPSIQD